MAEIKIGASGFSLSSSYKCLYRTSSEGLDISYASTATTSSQKATFTLPDGVKVARATVHATLSTISNEAETCTINGVGVSPGGEVSVPVEVAEGARGVDVWFIFQLKSVFHDDHDEEETEHGDTLRVSSVYLLIETEVQGGIIYRAEGGELVPYRLYRAEGGELVPYRLYRAEGGELVPY